MATYIFTWNPSSWQWPQYDDWVKKTRQGQLLADEWSCGNRRRIVRGDRVFLLRQRSYRGLIGAGWATSSPRVGPHWDETQQDKKAWYVNYQCEVLLPADDRLPVESLLAGDLGVPWNKLMASGVQIPPESEEKLEELWRSHLAAIGWQQEVTYVSPDEVWCPSRYWEGSTQMVTVNRYERNAMAREACIEHYGARCAVCRFDFSRVYGEIGAGYINVHHLRDLAMIGEEYEVDPIQDLRPVCPNCHAMLHTEIPAMTIEALRKIVARRRATTRSGKNYRQQD